VGTGKCQIKEKNIWIKILLIVKIAFQLFIIGEHAMSKTKDTKKETKKKPAKSLMEKRAAKKEKRK
jgi:hypothetical protein